MLIIKNTTRDETITAQTGHTFAPGKEVQIQNETYTRLLQDGFITTQIKLGNLVITDPVPAPAPVETTADVTREWLAQATKKQIVGLLENREEIDLETLPTKLDDLRAFAADFLLMDE